MLDPARLRVDLGEFLLGDADHKDVAETKKKFKLKDMKSGEESYLTEKQLIKT